MRTNIVLNDDLLREAQQYSRAKTKTALVEEALRVLVEVRSKELRQRSYSDRLLSVQQALRKQPRRSDALQILREDRNRDVQ